MRYINKLHGKLFIISAPSGSGKTTLLDQLVTKFDNLIFSVSYTTRKPRGEEKDGVEYFFVGRDEFHQMVERGEFLEFAEVHGNFYGTSWEFVDENLSSGRSVILDIDVQGKALVQEKVPDAVTVFLMPPSYEELKRRLKVRQLEDDATIRMRLAIAKNEILRHSDYDYIVINDKIDESAESLESVIRSGSVGTADQKARIKGIIDSFGGVDC